MAPFVEMVPSRRFAGFFLAFSEIFHVKDEGVVSVRSASGGGFG
jgi:hypothetical protein